MGTGTSQELEGTGLETDCVDYLCPPSQLPRLLLPIRSLFSPSPSPSPRPPSYLATLSTHCSLGRQREQMEKRVQRQRRL